MMESQNRKRAPAWTEREVWDLIAVWGEESVLSELRSSFRNAKTFVKISKGMKDRGHNRDPKQCRVKLKEQRQAYQKTREANGRSGSEPQTCRFYDELHAILGGSATTTPAVLFDSFNGDGGNTEAGFGDEEDDDEEGVTYNNPEWFYRHVAMHAYSTERENIPSNKKAVCCCHWKEQVFVCQNCDKRFANERLLRDHMRVHVTHVTCPFCDMVCTSVSSLKAHIRFRHCDERPFHCDLCESRYKEDDDGYLRLNVAVYNAVMGLDQGLENKMAPKKSSVVQNSTGKESYASCERSHSLVELHSTRCQRWSQTTAEKVMPQLTVPPAQCSELGGGKLLGQRSCRARPDPVLCAVQWRGWLPLGSAAVAPPATGAPGSAQMPIPTLSSTDITGDSMQVQASTCIKSVAGSKA
ncbi:Histone H4 transcription factor [Chelonia mydas]|uniref:Histone H4 transcription factor n=1 Tax=Chelonia mydas TaxID=8469 RepID=M7B2Y8_CHEMY|nr:Histone H4 transcription factor [Chelonia mydas]